MSPRSSAGTSRLLRSIVSGSRYQARCIRLRIFRQGDAMSVRLRKRLAGEEGVALAYMAVGLTGMLLMSGLAVDTGRAYVVKAQLSKAVDGAALRAARSVNSGNPRNEATRIFRANFPASYLGTIGGDPTADPSFFTMSTNSTTG